MKCLPGGALSDEGRNLHARPACVYDRGTGAVHNPESPAEGMASSAEKGRNQIPANEEHAAHLRHATAYVGVQPVLGCKPDGALATGAAQHLREVATRGSGRYGNGQSYRYGYRWENGKPVKSTS